MNTTPPKYLKKIGAPDWDYHIYTPYLAARGDMLLYEPPARRERTDLVADVKTHVERRSVSLSEAAREIGIGKETLSRLLSGKVQRVRKENLERITLWLERQPPI